ncbi:methyltransferase [Actinophytocola sp.]|uniref:methyltransferase n=1 Tax=Actinophytocola sp. TaxID=1872138 RepID=UPI003D6B9018
MTRANATDPRALRLIELSQTGWLAHALGCFAELGVADAFPGDHPAAPATLAERIGCDPVALRRLLQALTCTGVVEEPEPERFTLTELGRMLSPGHPSSLHDLATAMSAPWITSSFAQLPHTVRTGQPGIQAALGNPHYWDYLERNPADRDQFHRGMSSVATALQIPAALRHDYRGATHVVDVAGGLGHNLIAVLQAYPRLRGTVLDTPETTDAAKHNLAEHGLTDRADAVGGDMFDTVPPGHDTYLMSFVLMDWPDDEARQLLRTVARAMSPDSTLLVVDAAIDRDPDAPANGFQLGRSVGLFEMVMGQARTRSHQELTTLFEQAGLRQRRAIEPYGAVTLFEVGLAHP